MSNQQPRNPRHVLIVTSLKAVATFPIWGAAIFSVYMTAKLGQDISLVAFISAVVAYLATKVVWDAEVL